MVVLRQLAVVVEPYSDPVGFRELKWSRQDKQILLLHVLIIINFCCDILLRWSRN